jgi:hypothetical protein
MIPGLGGVALRGLGDKRVLMECRAGALSGIVVASMERTTKIMQICILQFAGQFDGVTTFVACA